MGSTAKWVTSACAVVVSIQALPLAGAEKKESPAVATARQDVQAALKAEVAGDNDRRLELLRTAERAAPELPEPQWHLGRVRVGNKWLSYLEAEAAAASDTTLAEYRKLREEASDSSKLLRNLARWCMKTGWDDAARLHYAQLLCRGDADAEMQTEAIKRLELQNVGGEWITRRDLETRQQSMKAAEESVTKWRPSLMRLKAAIDGNDLTRGDYAIKELHKLDDPRVIPALETFISDQDSRFQEEVVELLAKFPDYTATEALVRFAVLCPSGVNRDEAIKALKARPPHEYCPLLLKGLVAPIKSQFEIHTLPNGAVVYRQIYRRELADRNVTAMATTAALPRYKVPSGASQRPSPFSGRVTWVRDDTIWALQRGITINAWNKAFENQVEASLVNAPANDANKRVFYALRETTGTQLPDDTSHWSKWWEDYNEYYWPKPSYYTYTTSYSQYYTPPPTYAFVTGTRKGSCFPAGTLIRTQTGLMPIEMLQLGDRVLSQDQDTGELSYRLVVRTTLRPPTKFARLKFANEEMTATVGHPFWVCGHGWKMAKELQSGDILHGLGGATPLLSIELPPWDMQAHNLVVDETNTYFVGQTGVLVHDNEFRKPTRAIVPGLMGEELVTVATR
jgi:hypothetical protein